MMKTSVLVSALLVGIASTGLQADAIGEAQDQYRARGAGPFQFERGEALWNSRQYQGRQCADCHGPDLRQPGRHQRTNKPIEPMAPSVIAGRYTDPGKMEKWFKRNCTWTWDRECTPQEKGDLLEYLRQL
jgi:mono/diheme cytochrome c family protein